MTRSPKSAVFRGDHDDLLDHLVFACNEHKANKPLEGFGRELVPFFPVGEPLGPLPNNSTKFQSCGSPPRSRGKASRKQATPPERQRPCHIQKGHLSMDLPRCHLNSSLFASTPGRNSISGPVSPVFPSSIDGASMNVRGSSPGAACPGFFSSPKPAAIPMPTRGFLSRASTNGAPCTFSSPACNDMHTTAAA